MKNLFLVATILLFIFSSCGNKKQNNSTSSHTHSDGTVHEGAVHSHEEDSEPVQESFEVDPDSTLHDDHEHGIDGDEEHDHDHDH